MSRAFALAALVALLPLSSPALHAQETVELLSLEDCVALALARNGSILEAKSKVEEYEAVLSEVESVFYPKLQLMGYAAPMYTVTGDAQQYQRSWKALSDWGPYLHLQGQYLQILHTFGRAEEAELAAQEQAQLYAAKLREAELAVALEVYRFAYLYMYTQSVLPTLDRGDEVVATASASAREKYDAATGEVDMADLMRLEYFSAKLAELRIEAESGASLALAALEHTMGKSDGQPWQLSSTLLPKELSAPEASLETLILEAAGRRPEWAQLEHGLAAATHLIESEKMAMAPALFLAAQFGADWAPTRDDLDNPYLNDEYNQLHAGFAIGFLWDFDPAKAFAKVEQAQALAKQVQALEVFASTGIPLRIRKSYEEVQRIVSSAEAVKRSLKAAQKWMVFSATAFSSGVGDARELLEGAAAFLEANAKYYERLMQYQIARVELEFAVGSLLDRLPASTMFPD
ncbi:MAG: TolC family protein [Myxococcota bacterium]|jgi:outer membrane protein TolC|nr:TolC family protein [Myxococcota bacterium]